MNTDPSGATWPDWSPDGAIAFYASSDGNADLFVRSADGATVNRLTQHEALDCCASWSPDGQRIAFMTRRDGSSEIYVMNADGSGKTNLTNGAGGTNPAWSPDGTKIAFNDGGAIYLMNPDGTGREQLLRAQGARGFSWSPDGSRLAFVSDSGSDSNISLLTIATGAVEPLTSHPGKDEWPSWSPDGRQIAFASDRHNEVAADVQCRLGCAIYVVTVGPG